VNPGPTPIYQWQVNGTNTGTNNPVFSLSTLTAGSQVSVSLTADAACPAATSNVITVDVSPVVTPSVTITSDYSGAICAGETVTFNAWPTNGGATPAYQWQVNGVNAGPNSNVFTTSTLNDGDVVSVILTSSEQCVTAPDANSNTISISVTPPSAPSVSITVNPSGPICQGDNVIFTATPTLGGSAPVYQWQVNGINTGLNSATFATEFLNDGDQVQVILTSSLTCAGPPSATSNVITMTVNPVLSASVSISASPAGPVCPGSTVTYTANPVNSGPSPSYQWQVNGVNSGTNSPTFTATGLNAGDQVRVILTSSGNCVSPVNSLSNVLTVTHLAITSPAVTINVAPALPVCDGTSLTFTATPFQGGVNPIYEWRVNGVTVGTNSPVYTTSTLNNGDVVRCRMTSNAVCPVPPTVASTAIIANIIPNVTPAVNIFASPAGPICEGTNVTFTTNVQNAGTAPLFQWFVNGIASGNGNTFSSSTLQDGDVVSVRLTSNAVCAVPAIVFSNDIIMDVDPFVAPQVWLNVSPTGPLCAGDSAHFTATYVNGGSAPVFQWLLNGSPAGTNSTTFSDVFNNGDQVQVVINSSGACLTTPTDTSNRITLTVNPNLTPNVSITASPNGPYCPGDQITFTATPANGGSAPAYQ
jgi:hypothetical protein